jgi:hypothetical protein
MESQPFLTSTTNSPIDPSALMFAQALLKLKRVGGELGLKGSSHYRK